MNPEDYSETTEDIPYEDLSDNKKKLLNIIDEEVVRNDVEQNTKINNSDFGDPGLADKKEADPEKDIEEEEDPAPAEAPKKPAPAVVIDDPKNRAVSRLMNTNTILTFYNVVAGRIGKTVNEKNPDCLKFDGEDTEDIGIILKDTVEEENWSRFPSKWMLLIVVVLIVIGKIFSWNKKPVVKTLGAGGDPLDLDDIKKQLAGMQEQFNQVSQTLAAFKEQNDLLKTILDKNLLSAGDTKKTITKPGIYKGHDLSNPNLFTQNGAIIDHTKAGEKGYTKNGAKMGIPSAEENDIYKHWKYYQEFELEVA